MFSLYLAFEIDIHYYDDYFKFVFFTFTIDIFVQFNTGIIKKGKVISSRKEIAINYIKG